MSMSAADRIALILGRAVMRAEALEAEIEALKEERELPMDTGVDKGANDVSDNNDRLRRSGALRRTRS